MSKRALMIDLETLGAGDRVHVPVLQVGGAVFSCKDGVATIHESWSVNFGLDLATRDIVSPPIDPETMEWWKKQPEQALQRVFFPPVRCEVQYENHNGPRVDAGYSESVKEMIRFWISQSSACRPTTVWANGVADFQWLVGLLNRYNLKPPWPYNAPRDYRTVRELAKQKNGGQDFEPHPQVGLSHCAMDDAVWQCHMLAKYLHFLGVEL